MPAPSTGRHQLGRRLAAATAAAGPLPTPLMVVDLEAFDANADDLARRAAGTPIRVASKSVRVPALLRRALRHDAFHGVLAFTLREALWLHEHGVSDDLRGRLPHRRPGRARRAGRAPPAPPRRSR